MNLVGQAPPYLYYLNVVTPDYRRILNGSKDKIRDKGSKAHRHKAI
jgi:hypothetical protein